MTVGGQSNTAPCDERWPGRAASTVLRAAAVVVEGGVVAILDRGSRGVAIALEAEGATAFCDDMLAIDKEPGGAIVARCNGSSLPLRAVVVLDRGEQFAVERSHDAVTLLETAVEAGARGPEHLQRQLGTCMAITRHTCFLEARVPDAMPPGEVARRLLAEL